MSSNNNKPFLSSRLEMDYKKIGFKAGLEIHQQLDTHKLFCECDSKIHREDIDYSFKRFLRPTQSELGDVDKAAIAEARKNRFFQYNASNRSTCLVEADEEPPHNANSEAIDVCLIMAILMNSEIVDEIHFMRKIVIDGSNTGGFQRTALVALNGKIKDVRIQTIAIEEDAARKIDEKGKIVIYGLDRLGIPLIEIATYPDIKNPEHLQEVAERIGLLLRATSKVKRGLGTIRQDLNISISGGARVEIKGVQSLSSISKVAEKEVKRQLGLVKIKETLDKRVKREYLENIKIVDISSLLKSSKSKIVQKLIKNGVAKGFNLHGFKGLLKQSDTRLGREFAVHAKLVSGIGGIIHSDELPGYGIEQKEVDKIKDILKTKKDDAFVIAIGSENVVDKALKTVIIRAKISFDGVTDEVRRALPDDATEYMRPMPGAARMYPETDVRPIRVTDSVIKRINENLPERPEEKHKRFIEEYKLNNEQTKQILASGYENDFEILFKKYKDQKNIIIRTFLNTFSELEKDGIDISTINIKMLSKVFKELSKDKFAKEGIPEILRFLAKNPGVDVEKATNKVGFGAISNKEIEELVKKIVSERIDFVKQRGLDAVGPLMGIVMKELRGKADGKIINEILKKEIKTVI
jgi:glutamyl-tRNA(Gln) amidotransferase subunit E